VERVEFYSCIFQVSSSFFRSGSEWDAWHRKNRVHAWTVSFLWMENAYVELCCIERGLEVTRWQVSFQLWYTHGVLICFLHTRNGVTSFWTHPVNGAFCIFVTSISVCSYLVLARICVCVYNERCYCRRLSLITSRNAHSAISEAKFSLETPTNVTF
jgi:hypothetical protein